MAQTNKAAQDARRKRAKVLRLLTSPKWAGRSTNWIAMQAGVSWLFADKVRAQYEMEAGEDSTQGKRVSRNGKKHVPYHGRTL